MTTRQVEHLRRAYLAQAMALWTWRRAAATLLSDLNNAVILSAPAPTGRKHTPIGGR